LVFGDAGAKVVKPEIVKLFGEAGVQERAKWRCVVGRAEVRYGRARMRSLVRCIAQFGWWLY
jgi:hypothetical protein